MPKPISATHKVSTPTVFGGSVSMKLKLKNVQMKLKTGNDSCLIFLRLVIVAIPYTKPSAMKNKPIKR